jgi:transducin (beta)-like 1
VFFWHRAAAYVIYLSRNAQLRAAFDATCRLWDSVTGECLKTFEDHKRPVYALKFNPTGRWLATGSGDGWLHIYDVKVRRKERIV